MDADEDKNRSMVSEAGSTPSFVSSSLVSFVANAQATLDDVQHSLRFNSPAKSAGNNTSVSMDQDASFASMKEDEDDRKLKQEVLDNLNEKNQSQVIEEDNNKEVSVLTESANLLMTSDEEENEVASPEPSPIRAVDTSHEQVNISMTDALSPDGSDTSPADKNQETKRDSGSSRASGWKDLIAAAPSKTESLSNSPAQDSPQSTKASLLSPESAAKSVEKSGASATPMSVPAKATAVSAMKETTMSPPIPTTVDPMAMSAALEVTSSLNSEVNPKLSASTPELAASSPWKNALQSMVARLEDRVTPPTPDQSTPSPVTAKQSPPKELTDDPVLRDTKPAKPSPMVASSSHTVSRQSVDTVSLPSPSTQQPSAQTRSRLILSPPDSLPPQSTEKKETLPSPVASSPQQVKKSGLILSPSDSLPKASPQVPRQSGLILSPSDSLSESSLSTVNKTEEVTSSVAPRPSAGKASPASSPAPPSAEKANEIASPVSPQAPRQIEIVLSPSDSLPKPSPSVAMKAEHMTSPAAPSPPAVKASSSLSDILTKPTSSPSTGSRLFQPAASSQAHVKAVKSSSSKPAGSRKASTMSSRLTQGTTASKARLKIVSPSARKTLVGVEEGRARARERVRQQKVAAEKNQKEMAEVEEKQATRRRTAEEGRALARERVKLRQAQGKTQPPAAILNGKENRLRPPNSVSSSSVRSSRRLTIPKSPNFATNAVLGDKRRDRGVRDDSMKLDPNPISRALGSPTHSDRNKGSTARSSIGRNGSRQLTVPKAPRLSTTAKYGDKPPPSLTDKKPAKPVAQPKPPTRKREFKPTQPVPFKFHSSKTCAAEKRAEKESEPSLAERMQLYTLKGLRDESSAVSSTKRSFKPTIPKSPQFSAISHRALPKSTAEQEEEMMEYFKAHPLKAHPVGIDTVVETGPPKQASKRRLTQPVPFHFRADERAAHAKPPVGSPDPEAKDLEECKKQFHARPLPRMSYDPPPPKETAPRPLTTPKPFNFSTDRRAALTEPRRHTSDEVEEKKQFHARPVPKTTYVGPKRKSRMEVAGAATTPRQYAGPPKLATSARTEPREASRLASQRNAEQLAKQREEMALRKQREKHQEDMAKACLKSPPPNIQPFHLRSEQRHEAYRQHLAEQLAQEEEEKKQKMLFTAKPLRLSDPPLPIHSSRPTTTPRPFALRSVSRHELWREERRQQLEAEERERQRLMNVKALPLPKSTYKYSPVTPASQKKRAEGDGERDLDSARKKAMKALQTAENEMPEGDVNVQGRSLLGSLMGS